MSHSTDVDSIERHKLEGQVGVFERITIKNQHLLFDLNVIQFPLDNKILMIGS